MAGLFISVVLMSPSAAFGAAPNDNKAHSGGPAVEALAACRLVADNAARLACYDQASARFSEAMSKGELVVMDQQDIRRTRRSLFGFTLPRIGLFGGGDKEDAEQEEIETTITAASGLAYDKYRIRIEDGAVWETTEAAPGIDPPRAGQKIKIKRGALGNYFLRIDGQKGIRGRRTG